jgi:Uma2 family endonuclease
MLPPSPLQTNIELVDAELPPEDEPLVAPETPYEMVDGELVYVPPSHYDHGERQSKAAGLLDACVRPEFSVVTEVLTRLSRTTEIAPDISVYPRARDPATGRRQVPELAFEVVGTQSLANAADRARRLSARGVRRVFAIDVERNRAMEWSPGIEAWRLLDVGACIEDRVLAVALAIEPLVKAVRMDDAIARALILKNNPVIAAEKAASHWQGKVEGRVEGRAHGRQDGVVEGVQRSLLQLLAARGMAFDEADRARILAERDLQRLERWLARAVHATSLADVLADA